MHTTAIECTGLGAKAEVLRKMLAVNQAKMRPQQNPIMLVPQTQTSILQNYVTKYFFMAALENCNKNTVIAKPSILQSVF